jgi:ELWxxDGT repeat protein
LWVSDGTDAGTHLVKDINPGPGDSNPSGLRAFGGRLYFAATAPDTGTELWVSDGTDAGTHLVQDITPGPGGSFPTSLTVVGDRLFFAAVGPGTGGELWVTDGTAEGTRLVQDINPGPGYSSPDNLTALGDRLFFAAFSPQTGRELWVWAPAQVTGFAVNDGSAQRSRVTSLTLTFDAVVTLDPGAISLQRRGHGLVPIQVNASVADGRTVVVLTFAGPGIIGGSLPDGDYTLTVQAAGVHDEAGLGLTADFTGSFFRLFGDSNGNGVIDLQDLAAFASTFGKSAGDPGYLAYFDYYGTGTVDFSDLLQLLRRIGKRV